MFVDDIWKATKRGDLEKVKEFIARDGIPQAGNRFEGDSLLTVACEVGHVHIVRYLQEFEDEIYDRDWYAPYAFAALENGHLEVLRVLLEFGVGPESVPHYEGRSLIDTAIENKQREVVLLLIEYGANLEEYNWEHRGDFRCDIYYLNGVEEEEKLSSIEIAAHVGRPDMVEFFASVGANLNGQSLEFYLEHARENEVLRLEFEEVERLREEVERKEQAIQKEIRHKKQLFKNTCEGRRAITKALKAGVDANHTDFFGNNMLFNFMLQGQPLDKEDLLYLPQLVVLTDLSHKNSKGRTAWEFAEKRGQYRAALYLMKEAGIAIPVEKRVLLISRDIVSRLTPIFWGALIVSAILLIACFLLVVLPIAMVAETLKSNYSAKREMQT